uniref:LOB domain-containing protein n=1 Tax=Leersia perrieri TaxID=77586 RepID=A0A0D9VWC1_9ORYZ
MSCNGCRVLRKGCSDACVLRPSIEWIDGAQPQANATVFVAKFFGRAGLVASLAAVPLHHRPALFRSLLYEACGRTINPVSGGIGLMWTGNWDLCQAAADAVLRGDSLRALSAIPAAFTDQDMAGLYGNVGSSSSNSAADDNSSASAPARKKRPRNGVVGQQQQPPPALLQSFELDLCLTPVSSPTTTLLASGGASDEHSTTTCEEGGGGGEADAAAPMLLNLFN